MTTRRSILASAALAAGLLALPAAPAGAADVKEIRIDWATYNPVGLLLKEKGFLVTRRMLAMFQKS